MTSRVWLTIVVLLMGGAVPACAQSATGLLAAVERGNLAEVRRLAQQRGTLEATAADGSTALHVAVRNDLPEVVDALLAAGAMATVETRYGVTPLSLAVLNGNARVVEALLKAGADANGRSRAGEPVLMTAARTGHVATIKALIAHGARVDDREAWMEQTALMWAATENHPAAVRALLDAGASINLTAKALEGQPKRTVDAEVACQVPHTNFPKGTSTAVMLAAREGSLESLKVLAEAGADVNVADPDGITALLLALMNAHYDEAAVLIEHGANVNHVDRSGRGALYMAAEAHRMEWLFSRPSPRPKGLLDAPDVMKMLLQRGANVDAQLRGRAMLLHHEATGNANLVGGSTPLLKAATTSDVELVKLLLDAGANPHLTNQQKTNTLMAAAGLNWKGIASIGTEEESIEVIRMLMAKGVDVNAVNEQGETAMHGAAQRGADKVIQFLVEHGAAIDPVNKRGRTPYDEAQGQFSATAGEVGVRRPAHPSTEALLLKLRQEKRAANGQ
jgi:ankyrin repeat protein